MAKELLEKINIAEGEATRIIETAKENAKTTIEKTHKEAQGVIQDSNKLAEDEANVMIKQKISSAQKEAEKIKEKTHKEQEVLKNKSIPSIEKAISWLKNTLTE